MSDQQYDSHVYYETVDALKAAEARVAELTARVGELEAALRDIATGPEAVHGKVADGQIDLDKDPSMFRLAAWRWCQEQARAVLAGSPAPERNIQEERMDAYQFGTVPAPVGEAERVSKWGSNEPIPATLLPEISAELKEWLNTPDLREAERAVVEAAMVFLSTRTSADLENLRMKGDALAKAREAGGE